MPGTEAQLSGGGGPAVWLAAPAVAPHPQRRRPLRDLERRARGALLSRIQNADESPWSLSHSGGYAALHVGTAGSRVGIDIETSRPRNFQSLAGLAFAPQEARQLQALPQPAVMQRFYLLWTLKEAFAKALGIDLVSALRGCSFERFADGWRASVPTALPWSAVVYSPRTQLTLAAVSISGRPAPARVWNCLELPGESTRWPPVVELSGPGQ
jgi:4'-phosphopantetheinyl transferase